MGWRERDWAKFTDEERRLLYGASTGRTPFGTWKRASGPASRLGPGAPPTGAPTRDLARTIVWSAVGAAVLALSLFVLVVQRQRHALMPSLAAAAAAPVVYGRGSASDGSNRMTCVAEAANTRYGVWVCTSWAIVQPGQSLVAAKDVGGPCGVRHVEQDTGWWVCDGRTPPPPDSLPPPLPSTGAAA